MSEQFLYFLQQMFNGVTLGSTYALIAIGYTMVYGIIGMINFAHGEVYMIGSYVSFMIIAALMMMGIDTSWLLVAAGFVGAIVIASAYGWSIERVAYRPVRSSKRLIALISAIGMSIFLQNYVSLTEGSRDVALPSLFNGQWTVGSSDNFTATITTMQLVIWVVTFIAMLALTLFIRYSRMGRACRACAEDLKMASLLGINTDRVIALTFVIGAAMAAVLRRSARSVLRRNQPVHRLYGRDEGLHRRGVGRHRQHSRGDDRRADPRYRRSALFCLSQYGI